MSAPSTFLPEFPEGPDDQFDIVLVNGDAYVDHPAFGIALIGRYLESLGYRVGILAQPDWKSVDDFRRFGKPRLFFGVSAGNIDSMVAHYTPDRRRRKVDSYSPGAEADHRPDLASVVYAQRCKEAYSDVPVVMGGVEASLRRFAHYDFAKEKVRGSVLASAKADYLVYGMGERAVRALAKGLDKGASHETLCATRGVAYLANEPPEGAVLLPDAAKVADSHDVFFEAHQIMREALLKPEPPTLAQPHAGRWVVTNPPAEPLTPRELDSLYRLPFARAYPERYKALGGIPALEPVRFSLVTHRGCYGGCSFCAISAHQGRGIVSRTVEGVVEEAKRIARHPDFKGTIQDVGGPTSNMYGTGCGHAEPGHSGCARPSCLVPEICPQLELSGAPYLKLLRAVRRVPGVKHAFVASGVRHDMLVEPSQRRLFRELVQYHVGGQMKVAPEHISRRPLSLMRKPPLRVFSEFQKMFKKLTKEAERELYVIPYLIAGHPGSTLEDAVDLARFVKRLGHFVEQAQLFTPTPMTDSTCMYWTRRDPETGESVYVPTGAERLAQRALVQYANPDNKERVEKYFRRIGQSQVLDELYGKGGKGGGRGGQRTGRKPHGTGGKPHGTGGKPHGTGGRSSAPRKEGPGKFNKAGKTGRSGKS